MNMDNMIPTNWEKVREEVSKVNLKFAELVDALDIDASFTIYKACYPYGAIIGDDKYFYYPKSENELVTRIELPRKIANDLAYAKNSIPIGMVLNKSVELFIDRDSISIPRTIYTPGTLFALPRELDDANASYHPSGLLTMSAGARSAFFLPNIGDAVKYNAIQRHFGIKSLAPKTYTEHWDVFRQITSNKLINCNWSACLLFFSEKWIEHLSNDPAWSELRVFLYQTGWRRYSYHRNEFYYNYIFSLIQQKRNLKPNPYIADTAKHFIGIIAGAYPGFVPATDNSCAPVSLLQQIFAEHYHLQYFPTIMHPHLFSPEHNHGTVYYSLQYPSTIVFSPKSRKIASTLHEMRELKYVSEILFDEIANKISLCANTIVAKIAQRTKLQFYHNKADPHGEIELASDLPKNDSRFTKILYKDSQKRSFPGSAAFVRGCVGITLDKEE